jgi:hypothetical protein
MYPNWVPDWWESGQLWSNKLTSHQTSWSYDCPCSVSQHLLGPKFSSLPFRSFVYLLGPSSRCGKRRSFGGSRTHNRRCNIRNITLKFHGSWSIKVLHRKTELAAVMNRAHQLGERSHLKFQFTPEVFQFPPLHPFWSVVLPAITGMTPILLTSCSIRPASTLAQQIVNTCFSKKKSGTSQVLKPLL